MVLPAAVFEPGESSELHYVLPKTIGLQCMQKNIATVTLRLLYLVK